MEGVSCVACQKKLLEYFPYFHFFMRQAPSILLSYSLIIRWSYLTLSLATATKVKFHENPENDNIEAVRAPRSQRYWDEHNIERPDYAKTDSEIWIERVEKWQTWGRERGISWFLVGIVVMGLYFLMFRGSINPRPLSDAERQKIAEARMSRFDIGEENETERENDRINNDADNMDEIYGEEETVVPGLQKRHPKPNKTQSSAYAVAMASAMKKQD